MSFRNLKEFIDQLEQAGELLRITEKVSPHLQIAEITDRITKAGGPALLFENTGTEFSVLINAFGSEKRVCIALGMENLDEAEVRLKALMSKFSSPKDGVLDKIRMLPLMNELSGWMPSRKKGKGSCQKFVFLEPDLRKLPVLTCWPHDGGPFITLPVVHTSDPNTGTRNVGMYRMQVFSSKSTGMHWHLHKNSARHYRDYKQLGKKMPVSVVIGGDPVYTYVATAPLPDHIDEYLLAGFLRKKKVELVKCITNDLEVPADADFVIEGYVDPNEDPVIEGPFGDHTGFYSLPDLYPTFHVTCITHRSDAVYPATIVGVPPQEDYWMGKATERIFLFPLRMALCPELVDMYMPAEGVFHNIVIASIKSTYTGQAIKVMNALWGAGQMMFNKILIIVDSNVDLRNPKQILQSINNYVKPERDIYFSRGPADVLDHSSTEFAFGGKIGIDATKSCNSQENSTRTTFKGKVDPGEIIDIFPEIEAINTSLIESVIPCLILNISKSKQDQPVDIATKMKQSGKVNGILYFIFTDAGTPLSDLSILVWYAANNVDPVRDIHILSFDKEKYVVIDACRKSPNTDQFNREWPNVVTMDSETIIKVDEMWDKLGVGKFLPSPSEQLAAMTKGKSAFYGKD